MGAPAERARRGKVGALGTVIVSLQQTQYDPLASLRIFARINDVMEMLAVELSMQVPEAPAHRPWAESPVLNDLPYGKDGHKNKTARMTLDLRPGRKLRVINQPEWDREAYGNICEVVQSSPHIAKEGHISLRFGKAGTAGSIVRVLGRWWLDAAIEGSIDSIPVLNCE